MSFNKIIYLQASTLCDFDRSEEIKQKVAELIKGAHSKREKFQRIFNFVKELPYGLDDWDLSASQVLHKGWGMCSGKTNLLIAMLRAAGIPARYRIYQIKADTTLGDFLQVEGIGSSRNVDLGQLRDHIDCEVWLGKWVNCDPGRDTPMERGLLRLGGSLERKKVTDSQGRVKYIKLAVIDQWLIERQNRRKIRSNRKEIFTAINRGFERLRELGKN
jgi:transglutaminase-like putative cysteine protease